MSKTKVLAGFSSDPPSLACRWPSSPSVDMVFPLGVQISSQRTPVILECRWSRTTV